MPVNINPIISLAYNLADGKKKYVLFCGAGVSKDAGVPTGWDVLLETLKKIRIQEEGKKVDYTQKQMENYYEKKFKGCEYSEIVKSLCPRMEEQREFLKDLFKNKTFGNAHRLIAEWIKNNLIRFVITTNFDSMIEYALDEAGFRGKYTVISDDEQVENSKPWVHEECCRIYKIHGTIEQGRIRNTDKDVAGLDKNMEKACLEILENHGVVVLGYAGNDKGIMDILSKRKFKGYTLYWTTHNNPVNENVKKLLNRQEGIVLKTNSASEFLQEVLSRVEIARSEVEQSDESVARVRFSNILKGSNVEIMQTIDEERNKIRKYFKSILEEVNEGDYKSLWDGYIKVFNYSISFLFLAEQIIKYRSQYWKKVLLILNEIYSLNTTGNSHGKNGLINYYFFTIFEIIGAIALESNAFEQIREILEIKDFNDRRDTMANIFDWNVHAVFLEAKKKADGRNWIVPEMQYFLQTIDSQKDMFEFDLRKRILEVDILYFIYSIRYSSPTYSDYWFPMSSVYLRYTQPEFIKRIKSDETYREEVSNKLFKIKSDELKPLISRAKQVADEFNVAGDPFLRHDMKNIFKDF